MTRRRKRENAKLKLDLWSMIIKTKIIKRLLKVQKK